MIRKAHLRFKNGEILAVDVMQREQVRPISNAYLTPNPLFEWPHALRFRRPRLDQPIPLPPPTDAPTKITDDVTEFHIDRASFDPDRGWQNYFEADASSGEQK